MTSQPSAVGDGIVVVDKPSQWTSHDVVARIRRLAGTRKVGHAGTLDPMATGVLVVGVNRATRLLTYLVGEDKEYLATMRLGVSTTTDDAEGDVVTSADASGITAAALEAAVATYRGDIMQIPSAVSAIKVDGQRAYARARAGEIVELAARPVTVHELAIVDQRAATAGQVTCLDVDVRVRCSSGTYVRALARDIGADLGVGGHLTALQRTRVGPFTLAMASTLTHLEQDFQMIALADAARQRFAAVDVSDAQAGALCHGQRIQLSLPAGSHQPTAAFAPDGQLVALMERDGSRAKPVAVFAVDRS